MVSDRRSPEGRRAHAADPGSARRTIQRRDVPLLIVLLVVAVGFALVGYQYYENQRAEILAQQNSQLTAVRDLKVGQIIEWRSGLLLDAQAFVSYPQRVSGAASWIEDPRDDVAHANLVSMLDVLCEIRGYKSATILTPDGRRWVTSSGETTPSARDRSEARTVLGAQEATLTTLYLDEESKRPQLDVLAPFRGSDGRVIAVLLLHRDPTRVLYPLIQSWPTPSPTSETLLVMRDGEYVVFLNDLRFRKGAALRDRRPLSQRTLLAVQAINGAARVVSGIDYRGNQVNGAVGPVPGSPWYIVAKVDQSEVYAPVRKAQQQVLLGMFLTLSVGTTGVFVAWRQRTSALLERNKRVELEARLIGQQYDYLTRYANDAVILANDDLRIVQANERVSSMYGWSREALLGMKLTELRDPSSPATRWERTVQFEGESAELIEARHRRQDETRFDVEISARMIESDDGPLELAIIRDVTDRKTAQDALKRHLATLAGIMESIHEPLFSVDTEYRYTSFNSAHSARMQRIHGACIALGMNALQYQGMPEGQGVAKSELNRALNGEHVVEELFSGDDADERRYLEVSYSPIHADDRVAGVTVLVRDVSEAKRAEEELRRSEERFRSIVESSPTGMYLSCLDADGELYLTEVNPAADRILGFDCQPMVGMRLDEAFPSLKGTDTLQLYKWVARGDRGPQSFETEYLDERISGTFAVSVFRTGVDLIAVDFTDITERKRAEDELEARTEDLVRSNAELEKFAYIASHDLQEPLRMVASYTQLLQKRYQGRLDSDADEFIGYAVDGAKRMQGLINELLAYSRVGTQGAPFRPTDLEQVLAHVLLTLKPAIEESGAIITHNPMPTLRCDPTQIGQVFQNLISNALKFRGEDSPRVHVGARLDGSEWVFCIKDNGIGVEEEYFDRIFVIFQRLLPRSSYPGTGMGLAICKRIIERHGGRIWIESKPREGSTFSFALRSDIGE